MKLCRVMVAVVVGHLAVLPTALRGIAADLEREAPRYGGTVNIVTQHAALNALSFNQYNWVWKTNHDGPFLDHLIAGDLEFGPRGSGENPFTAFDWIPPEQYRGELADSWSIEEDPLRLVFNIRQGIYWPAKEGVMPRRELVASDIVFFFTHMWTSPRRIPTFWEFIREWKAEEKYTAVAYLNEWNAIGLIGWLGAISMVSRLLRS